MRFVYLFGLVYILTYVKVQAQIVFDKYTHDYGPVSSQMLIPGQFYFTNTGDRPLAILRIEKSPDVIVKYENRFYSLNEKGLLTVFFDNNKLGTFREDIKVYTNQSNEPVKLTIKGRNVDILDCNSKKNREDKGFSTIYVIDKNTKQPLKNAWVQFHGHHISDKELRTNRKGMIQEKFGRGQYTIQISSDGYQRLVKKLYISCSGQVFIYELEAEINDMTIKEPIEKDIPQDQVQEVNTEVFPVERYSPNNIVLLLDVSLSMANNEKLFLLKNAINQFISVIRPVDKVTVIAYSTNPRLLASGTSGNGKDTLHRIIDSLNAFGITDGVKGLDMAYKHATLNFIADGNNQIILATDGKFTASGMQDVELEKLIELNSKGGNILSIIGFGHDEKAIENLQKIATLGGGKYLHVEAGEDLSTLLIEEIKNNSLIQ